MLLVDAQMGETAYEWLIIDSACWDIREFYIYTVVVIDAANIFIHIF